MSFPFIGDMGKIPKNAAMIHIAKPVLPIRVKPPRMRRKKMPANAKDIKISNEDRVAPRRLVNFGAQCTLRVGDEKGIRKAKVVTRNVASPKYQILCSVQTPCFLEYTIEKKVLMNPTKMLVAKTVGRTKRICSRLLTLT